MSDLIGFFVMLVVASLVVSVALAAGSLAVIVLLIWGLLELLARGQ